jgi:hypothetical protein
MVNELYKNGMSRAVFRQVAESGHSQPIAKVGALLRIVGVGFGIAVGVGGTIGSGILRTPGEVAAQL